MAEIQIHVMLVIGQFSHQEDNYFLGESKQLPLWSWLIPNQTLVSTQENCMCRPKEIQTLKAEATLGVGKGEYDKGPSFRCLTLRHPLSTEDLCEPHFQ